MSPKRSQKVPLKRTICSWLIGANRVGLVLILIPGSSIGTTRSCG
jgi:hypothetical protein